MIDSPLKMIPGHWSVYRYINDQKFRQVGYVRGCARIKNINSSKFLYDEKGTLSLGQYIGEISQQFIYDFKQPNCLCISRNIHLPLVDLVFYNGTANGKHKCGSDSYTFRVALHTNDQWVLECSVLGPRKQYNLITWMRRR